MTSLSDKIKNLTPQQIQLLLNSSKKQESSIEENESYIGKKLPLSFAQKRIFFHSQIETSEPLYNNPLAVRLFVNESFDVFSLQKVINEIILRHDILRTTFHLEEEGPYQQVHMYQEISIGFTDLSLIPEENQETEVKSLAIIEAKKTFDLSIGPLIRFHLFQFGKHHYLFLLTTHHIISDGWANTLFFQELAVLCGQKELPPPVQYFPFVSWETAEIQKKRRDSHLVFWESQLSGELPSSLFLKQTNQKDISYAGSQEIHVIPSDLSKKIRQFSQKNQVTVFVTLLTAWNVLLFLYTGQKNFILGLPYANRLTPQFQKALGLFMNLIPYQSHISPVNSCLDYLNTVKLQTQEIFAHGECPFDRIVERINPVREVGVHPLFQVLFVHQNFPLAYKSADLTLKPFPLDLGLTPYQLSMNIEEFEEFFLCKLKYACSYFYPSLIKEMLTQYQHLLSHIIENPNSIIEQISLSSLYESHSSSEISYQELGLSQKLANKSLEEGFPKECQLQNSFFKNTIGSDVFSKLFEEQAKKTPNAIAIQTDKTHLNYQELNERANQLAHYLRRQNIEFEQRIGILMERDESLIIAVLGILKAGGAFVPIDTLFPEERIQQIISDAQISFVVTASVLKEISSESSSNLELPIQKEMVCYIIYTSGSTGIPKGVCIEHRQFLHYLLAIEKEISSYGCDTYALLSTPSADMGYTNIFFPLIQGKTVIVLPSSITLEPEALAHYLQHKPVDCIKVTPSQMLLLLQAKEFCCIFPKKLLLLAGERVPYTLIETIQSAAPACQILLSYGPTETTVGAMTYIVSSKSRWDKYSPLGRPNSNTKIYLLNAHMEPTPKGMPGEIYIGGESVGRGYLNEASLTAMSFVPDPFSHGKRLYKTGDLARYREDGELEFIGRNDRQAKIRGYRIELQEIETILLSSFSIDRALVTTNEEGELIAFIASPIPIDTRNIRKNLASKLPPYMIPTHISVLDAFPLLLNGKIDLQTLHKLPLQKISSVLSNRAEPRDALELSLVKIWEELLQIHPIGIYDDFFELGGHSFLAIRMMAQIQERFQISFSLGFLFECRTIERLAEKLRTTRENLYRSPLISIQEGPLKNPLYFVHPAGGQILCYQALSYCLKDQFSFYGLQAPFMNPESHQKHTTIRAIATDYLDALEQTNPKFPFVLGGWSLGGVVAYEMAQQYARKTKMYPLVILLDLEPPEPTDKEELSMEYILRLIKQVERFNNQDLSISPDTLYNQEPFEQTRILYDSFIRNNLLPAHISIDDFHLFLELQKTQSAALRRYEPMPYAGKALLIRARESNDRSIPSLWEKYITDLEIRWVSGNHITMMTPLYAKEIADAIKDTLS